jgi:BirA family biotin operon repressor/biotin-[acetyl-CoA-carboxylase] ligase
VAPRGAALLLSLGFRPAWLAPDAAWRLAAIASMAMAEAAEAAAGLTAGTIRLKWPNDLVVERPGPAGVRKLAGVLGETDGLGGPDPRAVVGLGLNADWAAADFPADLAPSMTSLRELAGRRPIANAVLLAGFSYRLAPAVEALRDAGLFDAAGWAARQVTTGRTVRIERADGVETVRALGVDPATGALVIADATAPGGERRVVVGEISHVRVADSSTVAV